MALLPHLGEESLYARFNLDEPWNSEHNRKLLPLMPSVFQIRIGAPTNKDHTHIVVPLMPGSIWVKREDAERSAASLKDGTANTMATFVSPSDEGVLWTKPDDAAFTPDTIKDALFGDRDVCSVGLFDGSILSIGRNGSAKDMIALVTIDDGESVNLEALLPRVSWRAPDPFTKAGKVDYLAYVNNRMLPRVPADQIWPNAIDRWALAAEVPGKDLIDAYANIEGPWKTADHPKLAEWLAARDDVLDQLAVAAKTHACFAPFDKTKETFLAEMKPFMPKPEPTKDGVRSNIERYLIGPHESVVSPLNWWHTLKESQKVRDIARVLRLRAFNHAGEGDAEKAIQDLLAMHRIARLVSRGMPDSALVGCAIELMACYADAEVLATGQLSESDCRKYLASLSKLPPVIDEALHYEFLRCQALDHIQSVGTSLAIELDDILKPTRDAIDRRNNRPAQEH